MLILAKVTGAGAPAPPQSSPTVPTDPLVNEFFKAWDIYVKPDGTKLYLGGFKTPGTDAGYVHEYDLPTPFDITTMTHSGNVLVTTTQERWTSAIEFKPDGTKLYVGGQHQSQVFQYDLSVPWDISSATYFGTSGSVAGHVQGIVFKPDDGSRMYITSPHFSPGSIREYQISTHWDVTSASFNTHTDATNGNGNPSGLAFKPDGDWLYQMSYTSDSLFQHGLTINWALSTTAAELANVDFSTVTGSPMGIHFGNSGKYLFLYDYDNDKVLRYTLGSDWFISSINGL